MISFLVEDWTGGEFRYQPEGLPSFFQADWFCEGIDGKIEIVQDAVHHNVGIRQRQETIEI